MCRKIASPLVTCSLYFAILLLRAALYRLSDVCIKLGIVSQDRKKRGECEKAKTNNQAIEIECRLTGEIETILYTKM